MIKTEVIPLSYKSFLTKPDKEVPEKSYFTNPTFSILYVHVLSTKLQLSLQLILWYLFSIYFYVSEEWKSPPSSTEEARARNLSWQSTNFCKVPNMSTGLNKSWLLSDTDQPKSLHWGCLTFKPELLLLGYPVFSLDWGRMMRLVHKLPREHRKQKSENKSKLIPPTALGLWVWLAPLSDKIRMRPSRDLG